MLKSLRLRTPWPRKRRTPASVAPLQVASVTFCASSCNPFMNSLSDTRDTSAMNCERAYAQISPDLCSLPSACYPSSLLGRLAPEVQ